MSEFKIHHCISELFALLGFEPELAEKYTESIKKSATPYVGTQISGPHCVRSLAQHSPDPRRFLDRYQELKNLNVQSLDALLVVMGGIADNSNVRRLIEGASRSLTRPDDLSSPAMPSILARLENEVKEANAKLSKDDLNELRNRLLKESQINHVPSDALKHILKEKTHLQLGVEIPEWLCSRPYLSLDFNKLERPDDVGPLGEVGISTQEQRLLEDLLSVMIGLDGTYITLQADHKPGQVPTFNIDSSVEPSLRALVSRFLPLCRHYSVIVQFIEEKSYHHHGLVAQALATAFRNLLKDYMLLVTQLESHLNRGSLTLHKMWFYVENTLMFMELLACIASSITKSKSHGGAVLSLLHERTLSLTGCKQHQDVLVYLTQAAAVPYFKMLSLWIYRGIINDPYKEFMIVDNEVVTPSYENSEDMRTNGHLSDDYWEKRYTVSMSNIPAFLLSHKDMILRTGKYLNVIRESDETVICPVKEEMLYSMEDKLYTETIERTYNFASKKLLKLLMDEKDLMGRLRSVKHYLLLDQGDFVVQLLSLCETELSKNIDDVLPTRLESLLELALRTSSANSDTYKDDVHCSLLPYTLVSQMLQILSIESEDEQEYRDPPERLQLSGLQGFSLTYSVTWPVSLVLDRKAHFCYQMIFRHLFYCKHVERLLCRVWICNKAAKGFDLESSRTYTAAFSLRQRMLNFIQNIEYYMMFEVIERNWQTFITKMQKVENIDEVLACHSTFIDSCLNDCMLTSPELLRIVIKLTNICVEFANFILSPVLQPTCALDGNQSFEQTIAKYDLEFNGKLVTLVDKISDLGKDAYNDALVNVLYRLDFNNYYKNMGNALHMVSSPEASMEDTGPPISG